MRSQAIYALPSGHSDSSGGAREIFAGTILLSSPFLGANFHRCEQQIFCSSHTLHISTRRLILVCVPAQHTCAACLDFLTEPWHFCLSMTDPARTPSATACKAFQDSDGAITCFTWHKDQKSVRELMSAIVKQAQLCDIMTDPSS